MNNLQQKNRRVALIVFAVVFGMAALSIISAPLYTLFCKVTGFGGTPLIGKVDLPTTISSRLVTVQFDAATGGSLPWDFLPEQRAVETHPGQKTLISYRAVNHSAEPVAGTALYNVSPAQVGKYFHKIECFCFNEQILKPGESVSMPVVFFIDPAIDQDPAMKDVTTITLSYTFFKVESPELEQALEDFYNQPAPARKGGAS